MAEERGDGSRPQSADRFGISAGEALNKKLGQKGNVFAALGERGQTKADGAKREARSWRKPEAEPRFRSGTEEEKTIWAGRAVSLRFARRRRSRGRNTAGSGNGDRRTSARNRLASPAARERADGRGRGRAFRRGPGGGRNRTKGGHSRFRPQPHWLAEELDGEAGNEWPLGRRAGGVQGAGCQVAASAVLAFDGRQGQMGRHALHLLNEPAHSRAAAGEAMNAREVLDLLGSQKGRRDLCRELIWRRY